MGQEEIAREGEVGQEEIAGGGGGGGGGEMGEERMGCEMGEERMGCEKGGRDGMEGKHSINLC